MKMIYHDICFEWSTFDTILAILCCDLTDQHIYATVLIVIFFLKRMCYQFLQEITTNFLNTFLKNTFGYSIKIFGDEPASG